MTFIKKYLKMIIGICVLVLAIVVAFFALHSNDLAGANLRTWRAASFDARMATARILMATDENIDVVVACVDKMSGLADSGEMAVRDAVTLCHTGILLKENL